MLAWAGAAAVVFAVAAGTVTAATLGHQHVTSSAGNESTVGRGPAPAATIPPAAGSEPKGARPGLDSGTPPITASGLDYQPATLADAARQRAVPARGTAGIPHEFSAMGGPAGLNACLLALTERYGGTVSSVDFARFQGTPAVIVVLAGPPIRVVAVGPHCGAAGAGTDEIYATTA